MIIYHITMSKPVHLVVLTIEVEISKNVRVLISVYQWIRVSLGLTTFIL